MVGNPTTEHWELALVQVHKGLRVHETKSQVCHVYVNSSFPDFQGRQMRQEIVTDEEALKQGSVSTT